MIIIETRLKKIPVTCKGCKFLYYDSMDEYLLKVTSPRCRITGSKVPVENKTGKYGKCCDCPLTEIDKV